MASGQSPRAQLGCLSSIVGALVLVAIIAAVVFVGFIALGVVAVLVVVGLLVLAVDRVMLSLSPKRRERRANQSRAFVWRFGPFPGDVVDAQAIDAQAIDARAIDTTGTSDVPPEPPSHRPGQPDES
jgi:type IV secretory pathway VirB3-like protein